MPRVVFPTRSRGTRSTGASTSEAPTKTATKATEPKAAAKTGDGAAVAEAKPATPKKKGPDPDLQERMAGLQGWMAEIERKQGRTTYFGAAAVVIAILAAGAALYFGITAKQDSAKKSDVDALTKKVDSLQSAVTKNSKDTQNTLNSTVTGLQQQIAAVQKQRAQDAANITALQSEIASGAGSKKGATALPGTATTTPGAKTKTTP